jgi:hypothetical protein
MGKITMDNSAYNKELEKDSSTLSTSASKVNENKNCLEKLDDWLWYNEPEIFEKQANSFTGYAKERPHVGRCIRAVLGLLMINQVCFSVYNDHPFIEDFLFLTKWGLFLTTITFILGNLMRPNRSNVRNSNRCSLWKVWTFLFQVSFLMEFTITGMFWSMLYADMPECNSTAPKGIHNIRCVTLLGDHCLPLFCLLVEYSYNAQPFMKRHIIPVLIISITYMIVNCSATFIRGEPIYPPIDWVTPSGIITPCAALVGTVLLFYLVIYLNNLKLKSSGYIRIVDILQGHDRAKLLETM